MASSEDNRNSGENTEARNPDGTFAVGNPGKPKGSRHRATQAVESLLQGQSEALTQVAIDRALEGDGAALRLCLERIAPVRKDTPVEFALPPIETAQDATQAAQAVLRAVSEGELSPLEAVSIMGLVDSYRRLWEAGDLEQRVSRLEASK